MWKKNNNFEVPADRALLRFGGVPFALSSQKGNFKFVLWLFLNELFIVIKFEKKHLSCIIHVYSTIILGND